jgi:flagellar hook-associated protein 2
MGLSSLGVGSGLDAAALVQSIMKAEQVPLNSLNNKKVDLNSKLTAYAQVNANLTQFKTAIAALSTPQSFQNYSLSSNDPSSISSSISGKPVPGFYSVEVNQLAQGQKLIGQGQASVDAVVGTGTVSFSFGSVSGGTLNSDGKYQDASFTNNGSPTKTITIDSSNNTLVGIRNAINASGFGVTASIVNDGSNTP